MRRIPSVSACLARPNGRPGSRCCRARDQPANHLVSAGTRQRRLASRTDGAGRPRRRRLCRTSRTARYDSHASEVTPSGVRPPEVATSRGPCTSTVSEARSVILVPYPRGVDLSNNNGDVDFDALAGSGIQFAICKASEGTWFRDGWFSHFWSECKRLNLARGAYHFA